MAPLTKKPEIISRTETLAKVRGAEQNKTYTQSVTYHLKPVISANIS